MVTMGRVSSSVTSIGVVYAHDAPGHWSSVLYKLSVIQSTVTKSSRCDKRNSHLLVRSRRFPTTQEA